MVCWRRYAAYSKIPHLTRPLRPQGRRGEEFGEGLTEMGEYPPSPRGGEGMSCRSQASARMGDLDEAGDVEVALEVGGEGVERRLDSRLVGEIRVAGAAEAGE